MNDVIETVNCYHLVWVKLDFGLHPNNFDIFGPNMLKGDGVWRFFEQKKIKHMT